MKFYLENAKTNPKVAKSTIREKLIVSIREVTGAGKNFPVGRNLE